MIKSLSVACLLKLAYPVITFFLNEHTENWVKFSYSTTRSDVSIRENDSAFVPKYFFILTEPHIWNSIAQCSRSTPSGINGFWNVDSSSVRMLHNLLGLVRKTATGKVFRKRWQTENLDRFAFQYLGIVVRGKRLIYINAFPLSRVGHLDDLTTEVVNVCDGGHDFWGVLFNIETKVFTELKFNGGG